MGPGTALKFSTGLMCVCVCVQLLWSVKRTRNQKGCLIAGWTHGEILYKSSDGHDA